MKQVLCMKWGTAYSSEYVNRLYASVKRNLTGPFRFVCLTDDPTGIRSEVECHPCPTIPIPAPYCNRGWRKVTLWKESIPGILPGEVLFLDLDIVITGNLDQFFEIEGDFIVCLNWSAPGKNRDIGNTSVYRFRVGSHQYLYDNLVGDPEGMLAKYANSQTYISWTIKEGARSFWPEGWCYSFKVHCIPSGIKRYFQRPFLPEGARIVIFPGVPNPHEAAAGVWPAKWYKKIYKHIRPATWVSDNWAA
ncbi:hypothetical protein [Planctomicrobium sp. SH664]|uniref:hypothetical protein n=1 Tax=Planctomicrobium sp. SH664 TaxID=3448125 RepID=UPI003F5BA775